MTVTLKMKEPLVVPLSARRRAGFKSGQELEFKAASGMVTIVPKLSPDELQDEREMRDPKIRAAIRKGHEEFLAGKTRPIQEFFAERALRAAKRPRRRPGA
jgi:bifunctional DNA-binding transcriptional regulator/antitoxin component of YhaV-PrlF toxin-antitoxin module